MRRVILMLGVLIFVFSPICFSDEVRDSYKNSSLRGRIIEVGCYVTSKSDSEYTKCRSKKAKVASVMGLLEKGTGKIYVLFPKNAGKPLPSDLFTDKGDINTVSGDEYVKGGGHFLKLKSFKVNWNP